MRIENTTPYSNFDTLQPAARKASAPEQAGSYGPGVVVEISQKARDYSRALELQNQSAAKGPQGTQKIAEAKEMEGCQTCKNREYVDVSDDPSVSFQTPQHIAPGQSGAKVMAHEREHVSNEQEKAEREERRVVSQSVSLSTAICPECGKVYVSGGVTRTVTANDRKAEASAETNSTENKTNGEENAKL